MESPNKWGETPLHQGAASGNVELCTYLFMQGAKLDCTTQKGALPLHVAAALGHTELAKTLIGKGANIEQCDKNGRSPVFYAVAGQHTATVQVLLSHQTTMSRQSQGLTPLHLVRVFPSFSLFQNSHAVDINRPRSKDRWYSSRLC